MESLRYGAVVKSDAATLYLSSRDLLSIWTKRFVWRSEGKADAFDKLQKIGCYAQNDKVISVMTNIDIIKRQKYNDIIGLWKI